MRTLVLILLTAKIGFVANDAVTGFKLLEKGFKEEDLGLAAIVNFPLSIVFGYYAAKWSQEKRRLSPWLYAFYGRLVVSVLAMAVVYFFPADGLTGTYFGIVILSSVIGSFMR
jgi:hypothetical protein